MNTPTTDDPADARPLIILPGKRVRCLSGNGKPQEPRPAEAPRKRWTMTQAVVLLSAVGITLLAVLLGVSWVAYRLQHTVVHNATVKGRLYRVGARMDGQVRTVETRIGQRVTQDQVLVRLVDDHLQAAARQAQAELQSALKRKDVEELAIEQERRRLTVDAERCESVRKAIAGDLEAAGSTRDKWERETDRISSLAKAGIQSGSELDATTSGRDNARALYKAAEGHLAAAESACHLAKVQLEGLAVRVAGLGVLAAQVDLARQRLAVCEADVAATVIRAPADGWVVDHIVESGGSAKVGEPLISLWLGAPWVEAWVDEKRLSRVKVGSPVDITLPAFPDRKLQGRVESIGVLADKELQVAPVPASLHSLFSDNAMIPVRISVPEDVVRLQPGLSAFVGIRDQTPDRSTEIVADRHSRRTSPVLLAAEPRLGFEAQPEPETKQH